MTTLEKLIFCKEHGVSLTYLASQADLAPATITKWIRGEKGMAKKNEKILELTLQKYAKEIWQNVGDSNDWDL